MRWGEAQGCRWRRWSQASRASCGSAAGPRPGQEREVGELAWRGAIGRLWRRRSRWALAECVCAGMGSPWAEQKTSPAPTASLPAGFTGSPFVGRKCTGFFSIFKEEAPDPYCLSGIGVDLCIGVGGSTDQPAPGRATVVLGGDVSLQNRKPRRLRFRFCRPYNFSYLNAVCENKRRWLTQGGEKG